MPIVLDFARTKLTENLRFCFFNLENETHPDQPFALNDTIPFDVTVLNPTQHSVQNLSIKISPGLAAAFEPVETIIENLPGESKVVVRNITAVIKSDPYDIQFFNHLAQLTLKQNIA